MMTPSRSEAGGARGNHGFLRGSSSDAPHRQPRAREVSLLLEIVSTYELMIELLDRELALVGSTSDGLAVLSYVAVSGRLTPSELSNALGLAPTTVTATIRRLVERGHFERAPNPEDGRSYHVTITPAGEEAFRQAVPAIARTTTRIEEGLTASEEVRHSLRALDGALRDALART
jgi:DNA-binding MarR family transcriptional regulator